MKTDVLISKLKSNLELRIYIFKIIQEFLELFLELLPEKIS